MRYRFIEGHRKVWPIHLMCKVLCVSRSGYYDWHRRQPGPRAISNRRLDGGIREVFDHHKQRYGAPRITDELNDRGITCSENRVARRMKTLELCAIQRQKFKRTTDSNHDKAVAPDLIERDFTAAAPNQVWVSDMTYGAPSLGRHLEDAARA